MSTLPPPPTRLRQIALVARHLERATEILTSVLGTEVIYRDPAVEQWGLKNILVPLGGDVIEIVSPFRADTAASRHLDRRDEGGYMVIMQTLDAVARRKYIEERKLADVIFSHELGDSACIQYHPRGIKGGVIPELDSHTPTTQHPSPLTDRFSPWHAAGPPSRYCTYAPIMRKHSHLHLLSVSVRLRAGDTDVEGAARQWENVFGVQKGMGAGRLKFVNAEMDFRRGEERKREGIEEIVVGVGGEEKLRTLLERARQRDLLFGDVVRMVGVNWRFVPMREGDVRSKI